MTPEEIKKIREELENISPWPWVFCKERQTYKDYDDFVIRDAEKNALQSDEEYYPWNSDNEFDWAFQAAAPSRIAALLDEVERLDHLHKLDHSLADQWQKKNEILEAKLKVAEDAVAQAVSDGNVLSTWTALKIALKKIEEA